MQRGTCAADHAGHVIQDLCERLVGWVVGLLVWFGLVFGLVWLGFWLGLVWLDRVELGFKRDGKSIVAILR